MLRFFEPEAEPRWSISTAPSDHYKCSRMREDSILPLRSQAFLTATIGTSGQSRGESSRASAEFESNSSYNGDFLNISSQDCKSFQFESIAPLPALDQNPGQTSLTMNPMELRVSGFTSHHDHALPESKKQRNQLIAAHQIMDQRLMMGRESKRCKAEQDDNNPQKLSMMAPTMKAPMVTNVKKSQKLGHKITALQQLVSPYGKTDTASVLKEACEHIKDLHQKIRMLSSPYFGGQTSIFFQVDDDDHELR
ncbi:uncharacterized protein A4U43_C07F2680 [Asparagus officinalis]|uniref:BHLH domain-containing protein n=1 Tax=Asparagus officinalis TaxID=4686 RepID=A0A5P1EE18_ASPOF|nr:transcription factor bHLH112-like [Asparagus officinalis]ONK62320.1 uncharacterized protein A4U43_C07F2680 [Asparagus officinalis]